MVVVSLTRQLRFTLRYIYIYIYIYTDTHFCRMLCKAKGHCVAGRISEIDDNDHTWSRTRNLPAWITTPEASTLPQFSYELHGSIFQRMSSFKEYAN
jgi:hypothetical protein